MIEYKPYLLLDNSNKNGHVEPIMDYVLSWCMRCTKYQYIKDLQPILYRYCKHLLCILLNRLQNIDDIEIDDVRVWKQERNMDLWVEVDLYMKDKKESHALLIENKYYTVIHDNQLERYRKIFDDYYNDKNEYPLNNRHYVVITCLYKENARYAPLVAAAEEKGFTVYHLLSLTDGSLGYKESESDIYNEIFLRDWL